MMMETVLQSDVATVALRAEPMSAQDVLRLALERFAPSWRCRRASAPKTWCSST